MQTSSINVWLLLLEKTYSSWKMQQRSCFSRLWSNLLTSLVKNCSGNQCSQLMKWWLKSKWIGGYSICVWYVKILPQLDCDPKPVIIKKKHWSHPSTDNRLAMFTLSCILIVLNATHQRMQPLMLFFCCYVSGISSHRRSSSASSERLSQTVQHCASLNLHCVFKSVLVIWKLMDSIILL